MNDAEKFYAAGFIAVLLVLAYYNLDRITGFAASTADVNIREKVEGKITNLVHDPNITIFDSINITAKFVDTGTTAFSAVQINILIYKYDDGLNLSAQYFDATVPMYAGQSRVYTAHYFPPESAVYYVQARVIYDQRIAELWSAFTVTDPNAEVPPGNGTFNETNQTNEGPYQTPPPAGGGPSPPVVIRGEAGIPAVELIVPERIDLYKNQSTIISVIANNTGETALTNLRLYVSTTHYAIIEINPKLVSFLRKGDTELFLISLELPGAPAGEYPLDLEIVASEIKAEKSAVINVLPVELPPEEDLRLRILNYKLLIIEIDERMLQVELDGVDTRAARASLDSAKGALRRGEAYYNEDDYANAKRELDRTRGDIEKAVFELAHASLAIRAETGYGLLFLLLVLAAVIIFIVWKRRRRDRRPRMLQESEE